MTRPTLRIPATRRRFLAGVGIAVVAAPLVLTARKSSAASCSTTQTTPIEGPYFLGDSQRRDSTGVGLVLTGAVRDAATCEPIADAAWSAGTPTGRSLRGLLPGPDADRRPGRLPAAVDRPRRLRGPAPAHPLPRVGSVRAVPPRRRRSGHRGRRDWRPAEEIPRRRRPSVIARARRRRRPEACRGSPDRRGRGPERRATGRSSARRR